MKRIGLLIVFGAAIAAAENRQSPESARALAVANAAKDTVRIKAIADTVRPVRGEGAKSENDLLAAELSKSAVICKKSPDALESVISALGKLRSKKGAAALKRLALRKKAKDERAASIQARALVALGELADSKYIGGIGDQTKNRNATVAKGAYQALGNYGQASGKSRRRVAEVLIKRLGSEYPSYSPSSGKRVSPEKRKRWREVSSSLIGSLQKVCRQPTIASVPEWEEWWKENKKSAKAWREKRS